MRMLTVKVQNDKYGYDRVECEAREAELPRKGVTLSGYGRNLPTRYMVYYLGRWYRMKVMQFGNAGTAYIVSKGAKLVVED